jgi:hypothetical protein
MVHMIEVKQRDQNPAGGFVFPSREFSGSLQSIVIDVERGSYASDAGASKFGGQFDQKDPAERQLPPFSPKPRSSAASA